MSQHDIAAPSSWVVRWGRLISRGEVLDVACGGGRHSSWFVKRGIAVVAVDRAPQEIPGAHFVQADLEGGGAWPFAPARFAGIVVTNYLHRPLFADLRASLAPDGVLIYETFMIGNERYGRPSNPSFLLRPGELLSAFADLRILAFEQGTLRAPKTAVIQRLCAIAKRKD
jgi:SAM-dependent methyltransferase